MKAEPPKSRSKRGRPTPTGADSTQPAEVDPADRNRDRRDEPPQRASKAILNQRTRQIARMILAGYSRAQIFDFASDAVRDSYEPTNDQKAQARKDYNRRLWDVCDRQLADRIKAARALIDEQGAEDMKADFILWKARLEDLYKQSYTIQDYKTCLAVASKAIDLAGLSKTRTVDPSEAGAQAGAAAAITVEEYRRQADQRMAAAAGTLAEVGKALEKAP